MADELFWRLRLAMSQCRHRACGYLVAVDSATRLPPPHSDDTGRIQIHGLSYLCRNILFYVEICLYCCNVILWCRDCREIVDRIHSFLQLDLKHAQAGGTPVLDLPQTTPPLFGTEGVDSSPVTDDASSVTSSEESFERVSTSDLAEYDATATDAKPPPATTLPGQADEQCASVDPVTDDVQSSSSGDMPCQ